MDTKSPPNAQDSTDLEETSSASLLKGPTTAVKVSTGNPPSLPSTSTSVPPSKAANEAEEHPPPVQPASDAARTIMMPFKKFVDVACDWGKSHSGTWRNTMEHKSELLAAGASLHDINNQDSLQGIKEALESMNEGGEPGFQYLKRALGPLGDMLRTPDFRRSFGEAGILDFCLDFIMQQGDLPATKTIVHQALRVVGNAVIDVDQNRARVVAGSYTKPLIGLLEDPELAPLALSVLNNVCDGNEPAQKQAGQNGLVEALMPILEPGDNEALVTMAWTLIGLASRHAEAIESSPDGILESLTHLALQPDLAIEDFFNLTNALLNYLKVVRFQELFVKLGAVKTVYLIVRHENLEKFNDALPEERQELSRNCLALVSTVSDCSDLPIFPERCPFQKTKESVLSFTSNSNDTNVQLLGCILAGNYANSEGSCREVIEAGVHIALVGVVMDSSDARVLHSALSALKNLAIPPMFRTRLAESGTFNATARICKLPMLPQVQLVCVSLIRQLITKSFSNITGYLLPRPPPHPSYSYLSDILSFFSSTDSLLIQLEIGRIITEIFRCLGSTTSTDNELETAYSRLHQHPSILSPITSMLRQSTYPALRSEAIFVLALIARREEGAVAIDGMLQDSDVERVVVSALFGETAAGGKDHENASVLRWEMTKHGRHLPSFEAGVRIKNSSNELL